MRSCALLTVASLATGCGYDASGTNTSSLRDATATPRLELVKVAVVGGYRSDPGELAGVGYGALLPSGDSELSSVGWIELAHSAEILAADAQRLLIVTTDSLGVETVTMKVFR